MEFKKKILQILTCGWQVAFLLERMTKNKKSRPGLLRNFDNFGVLNLIVF